MKTSETQTALLASLLEAVKAFPPIAKTKEGQNGNRKFKYAPLEEIKALCDPILWANGLILTQGAEGHLLVTRLEHAVSGEWRETRMPMNEVHASDQAYGIEFSYKRRYSYQGILGIVTEEDVDGNARKRAERPEDITKGGTLKHAVRDGIGEDLPEDWKIYLTDLAQECRALVEEGTPAFAAQRIAKDKLDSEQRTYLENKMDSKTRSAIKKAETEIRAAFNQREREPA